MRRKNKKTATKVIDILVVLADLALITTILRRWKNERRT